MNPEQRKELYRKALDVRVWSFKNPTLPLTDEHRAALKAHRLVEAADPNDGITVRDAEGNIHVMSRSRALAEVAKPNSRLAVAE